MESNHFTRKLRPKSARQTKTDTSPIVRLRHHKERAGDRLQRGHNTTSEIPNTTENLGKEKVE